MRFTNGLVVSLNIGACGYNDNHDDMNFKREHVETETVEIAVWDGSTEGETDGGCPDNWVTKRFFPNAEDGSCSVIGYVTMEEFERSLPKIIAWRNIKD